MEASKLSIILVILVINPRVAPMIKPNEMLLAINKGDIFPYCMDLKSGGDKFACRLKQYPDLGFLFCKEAVLGNHACEVTLNNELKGLISLQGASIQTVTIISGLIHGITCPNPNPKQPGMCSGFFEKWIDDTMGRFFHVSVYSLKKLAKKWRKIVQQSTVHALKTTLNDLKKIVLYMTTNDIHGQTSINKLDHYRCICDLQGFFIFNGGFLVSDTEGIEILHKDEDCNYGGPTAEEYLLAVQSMIDIIEAVISPF